MHIRCPHCHDPIGMVDDTSLAEINCPSCGSSFSLISGDTTETHHASTRRIAHFELVRELGIGKFGSVWMARDTELDRTVAIKIPRKGALDPEESEMFLRDARAAAQLKHPHIVGVHEVGREEGTVYIVSDYVEGANLKEWLSGQRLSFRESAELVVKVAEALYHAHQSGVVHRDLKPGNIMLDHDGQPHVIDFGLAKREAGEITMTVDGQVLGTPAYMSPEQARGKGHDADARSDVYSLGVILFELLTGELPFRGETQMLVLQIQRDEPRRPRRLNSRIPRDLETIALKCLEKEPARRYQSAQDLADDLGRWLDGRPIVARPVNQLERGWRWCRRNPTMAALSLAVLCLAAVLCLTFFHARSNADTSDALSPEKIRGASSRSTPLENRRGVMPGQSSIRSSLLRRIVANEDKSSAKLLVETAQSAVDRRPLDAVNQLSLGGAHYRAGNYKEALKCLKKGIGMAAPGVALKMWNQRDADEHKAVGLLFSAMAHHRLGNTDEARAVLEESSQLIEKLAAQHAADLPRYVAREAEMLIQGEQNDAEPATASEAAKTK